ncbi:hypothetical protein LguiA_035697 [Lonicera macranthoides]
MASDGANQPKLAGLLHPAPKTDEKGAPTRKRYRRTRSAPMANHLPAEMNGKDLLPHSESSFSVIHTSFKRVAIILIVYLGIGAICFYLVRHQIKGKKTNGLLDAVYFCIVTMTTVGYGDLVPNSVASKLLACAFVFSGMALVGLLLCKGADYLVEKQEMLLVKALHLRQNVGQIEIQKEIEGKKKSYKCFMALAFLLVLIVGGTIFLATVEKLSLLDSFYCVCCTITTLGYGDVNFSTKAGRIFAIFWILTGTLSLAQFFLYVSELNTERRQKALVNWVLTKRITNVDLEAADLDNDGVVGGAEFVIYKLKEMGKISQEDVSLIMEEFEDLDYDQSGTLSTTDIKLSQSSLRGS